MKYHLLYEFTLFFLDHVLTNDSHLKRCPFPGFPTGLLYHSLPLKFRRAYFKVRVSVQKTVKTEAKHVSLLLFFTQTIKSFNSKGGGKRKERYTINLLKKNQDYPKNEIINLKFCK